MADIQPFYAWRYDVDQTGGTYDDLVTPPFDVIDEPTRASLAARSPHNYVHLILPEAAGSASKYERAASLLGEWQQKDVLRRDPEPGYYLLEQEFKGLDGATLTRRAFFAVVKLPEPGDEDTVLGHERTFDYKVQDRLDLTLACRANLGAVFMLYDDPEGRLKAMWRTAEGSDPVMEAHTVDGVRQRVWRIGADGSVAGVMRKKTLYIADGHHRFRTAVITRDRLRAENGTDASNLQPYDYALIGLVEMNDPGLVVWPAHRLLTPPADFDPKALLEAAEPFFEIEPAGSVGELASALAKAEACALGCVWKNESFALLRLRKDKREALLGTNDQPALRALDVTVLHRGLMEHLAGLAEGTEFAYEPRPDRVSERLAAGEFALGFMLRPMAPQQVRDCADARVYMPQKATYFFPKLPSGMVIHTLG
jgi:uncharacterized protein (DUF1015 family)